MLHLLMLSAERAGNADVREGEASLHINTLGRRLEIVLVVLVELRSAIQLTALNR